MLKHTFVLTIITVLSTGLPLMGQAYPVEDLTTEYFTALSYAKQADEYLRMVEMLKTQIEQLKDAQRNSGKLSGQQWGSASYDLQKLAAVMNQGTALSYSAQNSRAQFNQAFPGYTQDTSSDYSQDYQSWAQTAQNTLNNAMDALHTSYDQQEAEAAANSNLARRAASAQGRMQALQVAGEIAAEQVAQLQKLKATLMTQTNAQTAFYAYQTQKDIAQQRSVDVVVKNASVEYPAYQPNKVFGKISDFKGSNS